jgi:hypothetical protein
LPKVKSKIPDFEPDPEIGQKGMFFKGLSRIFYAPDALICKAFRGEAVVFYCKPLITQQMGVSGSAQRGKIFQLKKKTVVGTRCNRSLIAIIKFN